MQSWTIKDCKEIKKHMKELIIIVYKINVAGLSRQSAEQAMAQAKNCSLKNDEELKENYIIREIFIPVEHHTDIKVIYPVPNYTSPELDELVKEISEKIKEDPSNMLKSQWNRLVRELKIRKLNHE